MKIGVLTLPLEMNYGGILQAYAMLTVLSDMGHEAWLIDRRKNHISDWHVPFLITQRIVQKYLFRKPGVAIKSGLFNKKQHAKAQIHGQRFVNQYISLRTEAFYSTSELSKRINEYGFDAVIVGSDQVWRPQYTPNIEDYFLGFLRNDSRTKRIAYAASFGTDRFLTTARQLARCIPLLQRFNRVSVRENTGVLLCRQQFAVEAEHLVDPTMLLGPRKYARLLTEDVEEVGQRKGGLLVYILDENSEKQKVVDTISKHFGLIPFRVNKQEKSKNGSQSQLIAPSVEAWINGFKTADFVVADSFHACVFALIFNKPFLIYGNRTRGMARFESLLNIFNLNDRLISSFAEFDIEIVERSIDWSAVNSMLHKQTEKAKGFLQSALAA